MTDRTAADGSGFDFEETLEELEEIARALDREDLGLDEAIALFERGLSKLRAAREWLDTASGRVEEIIASASGRTETRPFEGGETGGPDDGAAG